MTIFSPNMLKTFSQCPKKYFFRYVKGVSMPINDELFESGKNIHALASYYLRRENIINMEKSLSDNEKILWERLKNTEYFNYETIETEFNINIKVETDIFGGRLDALVKKDDAYYILDYKTGSAPKDAKYDFQTMIYMLAIKEFFNAKNVVFVYIDLKNQVEVKIDLTEELIEEYQKRLLETVKNIKRETFAPKQKECVCEYKPICY